MPRVIDVVLHADPAVDVMLPTVPGGQPRSRPGHAKGLIMIGWFQASSVASTLSHAELFNGARIPVTVQFSNEAGAADEPDSARMPRRMAVQFHLGATATDLAASTLPVLFTKAGADLIDVTGPMAPRTAADPRPWYRLAGVAEQLVGTLKLLPPDVTVTPAEKAMIAFADGHPPARLAAAITLLLPTPESYATCCFHAVHAVRLTAGTTTTSVRFNWEPVAGVRPAAPGTRGDFLHQEMARRLARGPVEFVMRAQVAEAGDDTSDPTTPWSQSRRRVVMGQLRLDTMTPTTVVQLPDRPT